MTRLIARLVLAMLILPISMAIFALGFFAVIVSSNAPPEIATVLFVWLMVYGFIAMYWLALWRDMVAWNTKRVSGTVVAALAAILAGAFIGLLIWTRIKNEAAIPVLLAGTVPPIVWVLATVFIWRETTEERLARIKAAGADTIVCPVCGYNMTGLKEARCPECGAQFTLDQLYASQPAKDHATLEAG